MNRRRFLVSGIALAGASRLIRSATTLEAVSQSAVKLSPGQKPAAPGSSTNRNGWFADSYFNLLSDYYTEVAERPYGTGYAHENLLPALQVVRPGFFLTYAKGHSGTTAFKSRLQTEHPLLGQDPLLTLRQVTREAGVRLFLYYSGLIDGKAAREHPEWQAVGKDGQPYGGGPPCWMIPVCPSSFYFENWVSTHLEEIMKRYDPDGIWVDGDWGGGGMCFNESCKQLCAEQFGAEAIDQPEFHLWVRNEFRRKFANLVHSYNPDCLYSAGNTTPAIDTGLTNYVDWQSGDWFTPDNSRIMQSIAMRRYTTLGIPYDAMTCDTQYIHAFTQMRSRVKGRDRMIQEGAGVLANGGKWCYWTYPMPDGSLIPSRMSVAKSCHEWADERKDLWLDTESARWTAALYSTTGPQWFSSNASLLGISKALIELHRSPDILHLRQLRDPFPHELVVLAGTSGLSTETIARLGKFVEQGGLLLSAGTAARIPEMADLLGIKPLRPGALDEGHVLLQDGTPAGIYRPWDQVALDGAEVWWKLYKSWDQDNPGVKYLSPNYPITGIMNEEHPEEAGFPAVTARRLGRGLAAYIAADPFEEYWFYGYPTTQSFLREILDRMQPNAFFRSDAPGWIEVSLRVRPGELLIHLVNGNPGRDMSKIGETDLFVEEIPSVGPIQCELRCPKKPKSVRLEPGHRKLRHTWHAGILRFAVPKLEIHACARVQPWPM